jgi:glycosyltransferase involved in cell wall biosynthesis
MRLAGALAEEHQVSVIVMRQLLPTRFYPGRERVGAKLTTHDRTSRIPVFDGVDWYWAPSLFQAIAFLIKQRPEIIVFQWWTATVLHSYVMCALVARLLGIRIVIEFHEVLDTGEARLALARMYVNLVFPLFMRMASGFVVHSEFDRAALEKRYGFRGQSVARIPHGPYDHYRTTHEQQSRSAVPSPACNVLFFGLIRPFKGLEDLIEAFDSIPHDEIDRYWLTVVGETWEGWTLPNALVAKSRYRDRITFVNRYVHDEEVAAFFAGADVVALPYHRSSASGPLHVAMSHGLPVIVTRVGGLPEAAADYEGAIFVPPRNPTALCGAIRMALTWRGRRFQDPHSWKLNVARYEDLFSAMEGRDGPKADFPRTWCG